ncbi:TPA: hypothetical protein N0F65_002225 [Lagenidium giganteum]|uniref:EH domain-containing protein n=1 Tax=Lagenidium giganteum TaxID=4803 RepID=A0AAV2YTK5_9STRA|nr:TPA: hypothetical protein N0F65_002225 [Lagenidium giganteum]
MELDRQKYTMIELEMKRYQNFFTTLDPNDEKSLPRDVAMEFFAKSNLGESDIHELWLLIKAKGLSHDADVLTETEFIMAMHLIVCMTKRGLTKLPAQFPDYLFPMLDLTPPAPAHPISMMPSPDKEVVLSSGTKFYLATSPPTAVELEKLQVAESLFELLSKKMKNKDTINASLSQLEQSEDKTLENLNSCLELIIASVEALGYVVPASARSLDALEDLSNLMRRHVQSLKQEVQTMQISSKILSEADDAISTKAEPENRFNGATALTQQLAGLQQESMRLCDRKDQILVQLLKLKRQHFAAAMAVVPSTMAANGGASHDALKPGGFAPTPPANPVMTSEPQEVRNSERTNSGNPFDMLGSGSPTATSAPTPAAVPAASTDNFGWGTF